MKQAAKLVLSLGITAGVVLVLFLLPIVSIEVIPTQPTPCAGPCTLSPPMPASASVMYAYFGVGAVQVPNPYAGGHSYCLKYGRSGTMCGLDMQRM